MKPRINWRTTWDGVRSSRRQIASRAAFFLGSISTLNRAVRSSGGGGPSSGWGDADERLAGERDKAGADRGGSALCGSYGVFNEYY